MVPKARLFLVAKNGTPNVNLSARDFTLIFNLYPLPFNVKTQLADAKKPRLMSRLFCTILTYVISYYK